MVKKISKSHPKPASQRQCPVEALIDEADALVAAIRASDAANIDDADDAPEEEKFDLLFHTLDALKNRASFLKAESIRGALFQVIIASDAGDALSGYVPLSERGSSSCKLALDNLHRSVASVLLTHANFPAGLIEWFAVSSIGLSPHSACAGKDFGG